MAFPYNTAGEPNVPQPSVPHASGGKVQPRTPKKVKVKAHTRTVKPKAAPKAKPKNPDQALIDAAVNLRYGPQEQAIGQQLTQNTRYTSGLGDWYGNAMREVQALQAGQAAQSQQALGQVTNYASQPTLPNATDQQAAGARNNLNAEFASAFGQNANSNTAALDRLQAAFLLQQGNTQNQANADRIKMIGEKGALKGQEGDYRTNYGAQLQSQRQTAALNQEKANLAAQALGLKVDTLNKVQVPLAQSLTSDRASKQRVARSNARTQRIRVRNESMNNDRKFQLDKAKFGLAQAKQNWQQAHPKGPSASEQKTAADLKYFKKHGYYPPTGPPKTGAKGSKPTQGQTKTTQAILDARARYENGIAHGESLGSIADEGRKHGVSETVLQIASYLATHNGKPNASVRRKLKALGVDPSSI
jgi:hypothetical protein